MKNSIKIILIAVIFSLLGGVCFAFYDPGCTPSQSPVNFCQNQNVWYTGVDFKLTPYGTHLYGTIHEDGRFYIDNCSAYNMYFSMLSKNPSTSQTTPEQDNGQFGLCDYGLALSHSYGGTGEYFYELYSGSDWSSRVAEAYAIISWNGSFWTPESSAVNGSCGSADGGSFPQLLDNDPDLCSAGSLGSLGVQDDGTTYLWVCEGSGGGSTDYCFASVLSSTAQCGTVAGNIYTTPEPTGTKACWVGSISEMTQAGDNSWSWKCSVSSTDYVSCATYADAPIIPPDLPSDDSISCSISPTDLSTIGDCLGSVVRWAFLPKQSTLNDFYSLYADFQDKVPFGYFYSLADLFSGFSYTAPADLVFTMKNIDGSDITLLDVNDFKQTVGQSSVDFYFNAVRAGLWLTFAFWVYNQGRNIFGNKEQS
jgi:hypothetical protein